MKRNVNKVMLTSLASILLMTGCKNSKVVEVDGEKYLQNGNEYVSINMEPKVFEPGTHFITYNVNYKEQALNAGWNVVNVEFPQAPDGYKYLNSITIDAGYSGRIKSILHIYVNEVSVEVEPTYNVKTGEIEYNNIGKPVKRLILE